MRIVLLCVEAIFQTPDRKTAHFPSKKMRRWRSFDPSPGEPRLQINLRDVRLERMSEADVDVANLFFKVVGLASFVLVERGFSIAAADIDLGAFAQLIAVASGETEVLTVDILLASVKLGVFERRIDVVEANAEFAITADRSNRAEVEAVTGEALSVSTLIFLSPSSKASLGVPNTACAPEKYCASAKTFATPKS